MSEPAPLVDVLLRQGKAWRRGERPRIEDILAEHPHLAPDDNAVLDLIYNEVLLREEAGEKPALADYLPRFPRLETDLRVQFEVDQALTMEEVAGPLASPQGSTVLAPRPAQENIPVDWLEGFQLLEEVGRGAMGVVWRAWQRGAKRVVALKLLALDVPPGRVRAEIEAAARLAHPNILPVFEVREDAGRTALVLEFADGGNLAKKLAGKPLPPRDAARLVETLAGAMAHAHARGVVHRDLKPSNVLLSGDEGAHVNNCVPRIGDFGLAKLVESDQQLTRTNDVLGTPSYMAPEQTGGKGPVGPAADIYSLGAILYECLTGRPPFLGESLLDTLEQVRNQDPVPPSHLQPRTPRDLEVICLKCLHKMPSRRYGGAAELAEDLRRFGAGEPIKGRPVGLVERVWKWSRRRPAAAALVAVTFLAAAVLLAGGVWVNQILREQRDAAIKRADERGEQLAAARRMLYTTQLLRVGAVWPTDPQQGLRMLTDERACPPDLRCFSWGVLFNLCKRHRAEWPAHDSPVTALAVSADGRLVASGSENGQVRLWDAATNGLVATLHEHHDAVRCLAFSADGRLLASGGDDGLIKVWDTTAPRSLGMIRVPAGSVAGLAFHPGGRLLASSTGRIGQAGMVHLWDTRTFASRRVLARDTHPVSGVALGPDGNALVCADRDNTLRVYDTRTGRLTARLSGHSAPVTAVAFAKGGRPLVTASLDGNLRLWDVEREREIDSFDTSAGAITAVAVHPNGQSVAVATNRPADPGGEGGVDLRLWDTLARRGDEPLRAHGGGIGGLAFTPDGKTLITGGRDRTLKAWDHPGRRERVALRDPVARAGTVGMSRDGRVLAWVRRHPPGGPGSVVDVYDLQRGTMQAVLTGHGRGIRCIAVSADGKTIASAAGEDGESTELLLWEAPTGRLSRALIGHAATVTAVAASADGREFISAALDGAVKVWDAAGGKARLNVQEKGVPWRAVAFSEGHFAAGGGEKGKAGVVCVWSREDGALVKRLQTREPVTALALSRDGSVAWAEGGGQVRLGEGAVLETGMRAVSWLAVSADGTTLAVAGTGTGVRLCDVASAQERAALPGHRGGACFAGFAADGGALVTASTSGQARVWHRAR